MSRNIVIAIVAIVVIGGIVFALNRPEPTPQERLQDAVKDTAESVKEAGEAVKDAVGEAAESVAKDVEKAASEASENVSQAIASLSEEIAASTEQSKEQITTLIGEWKDSGIITEDGVDFDKASQAVDESSLSDENKKKAKSILSALRDAPGAFSEKLAKLEAALGIQPSQ